jgi:hypothetical protein
MSDFDAFDSSDPTADFLEREKAILGAEAALFGNPITDLPVSDTGNTFKDGGFGDFIDSFPNTSPSSQPMSNTLFDASKGDPFGLANDFSAEAIPKANSYVEDSHNIDLIGTEPAKKSDSQALLYLLIHNSDWQVEFDKIVQERDTKAKEKHERILKDAQDSLDKFYAEYNQRKSKAIQRNKELENQSSQKEVSGNVWVFHFS